jgi:hypothetical protein
MNLPLQVRAISRGSLQKSRIAGSAGQVLPSWLFVCDPPMVACSCSDNSVACCDQGVPCNCGAGGTGPAGCGVIHSSYGTANVGGASGHCKPKKGHLDCAQGNITCFDVNDNPVTCQ